MLPLLLTLWQVAAVQAEPPPDSLVYNGRLNELAVEIPKAPAEIEVDGVLDEPVWNTAAILTGFSQYSPVDGRPAEDSTEVRVWYSSQAIYFGVKAYDAYGSVRATLADRDRIESDDQVRILLDTFDDGRGAFLFAVNPLGVQADGVRNEGVGFGRADHSPDFVFDSEGRVTDYGYEVEIRIPFKSLRYQAASVQDWGINIIRIVQRTGQEQTWTPARRGRASFLAQSGKLVGLKDMRRGLVLDLNPLATAKVSGTEEADGWDYGGGTPEFGVNVRWGMMPNFTLNGTINPDFSQVEADVGQVPVDPRFAVSFPEKRPFFVEGSENFNTPNDLVYSRRIGAPLAAAKLTGRMGATNIGILSAVDDESLSRSGEDRPIYNIVRLRTNFGESSTAGAIYTDKIDGESFNRVVGGDARIIFARQYELQLQGVQSFSDDGGEALSGPLWEATIDRTGRTFGLRYSIKGVHPDFRTGAGFVNRTDILRPSLTHRFTRFGSPDALLQNWTIRASMNGVYDYNEFFEGRGPLEALLRLHNSFDLSGGWRLQATPLLERVRFDPAFYAGYGLERLAAAGLDTVPFILPDPQVNIGLSGGLETPQFKRFSGKLDFTVARDVNYFETGHVRLTAVTLEADWRPTDRVRVNGRYLHQRRVRPGDGSRFSTANIPRVKVEYQVSRPMFFRLVAQYTSQERDVLRDPSTGQPFLIRGSESEPYVFSTARSSNDLRLDALFSYQPTPGTVFFAGYGSSLAEPEPLRLTDLQRVNDGFFLKLSYLFRL